MAQDHEKTLKFGDTSTPVRAEIRNRSDGQAPDWTSVLVRFKMFEIDALGDLATVVDSPAAVEIPAATSGTLVYTWAPGDTDRVGRFPALFTVTEGSVVETYPEEGYIWVNIEERGQ